MGSGQVPRSGQARWKPADRARFIVSGRCSEMDRLLNDSGNNSSSIYRTSRLSWSPLVLQQSYHYLTITSKLAALSGCAIIVETKDLFNLHIDQPRNLEGQRQARIILSSFAGVAGLLRHTEFSARSACDRLRLLDEHMIKA